MRDSMYNWKDDAITGMNASADYEKEERKKNWTDLSLTEAGRTFLESQPERISYNSDLNLKSTTPTTIPDMREIESILEKAKDLKIPLETKKKKFTHTFESVAREMIALQDMKNTDYDNIFEEELDEDGISASKTMLSIKMKRYKRLTKHKNKVKDETIQDTLIDLAAYAIMTLAWLRNQEEE